jgi:hypothetical protein
VIDPDLLSAQDLRTPEPGDAAYDLWKARRDNLAARLAALDTTRKAQPTQQAGFDRIVSDTLGPVEQLLALIEQHRGGNSIDSQLRARRLTMQPFLHLMRVRELAVANTMLDEEWNDVYSILLQAQKFDLYATWRGEERQKGLILGPDSFLLSDITQSQIVTLPRWRATQQARQAWRRTLDSRLQQDLALTQAMQSAVSEAEKAALPMLRDACVAAIAGNRDVAVIADRLTEELGIDWAFENHSRPASARNAASGVAVPSHRPLQGRAAGIGYDQSGGQLDAGDRGRGFRRGMALDGWLRHLACCDARICVSGELFVAGIERVGSVSCVYRHHCEGTAQPDPAQYNAGARPRRAVSCEGEDRPGHGASCITAVERVRHH